MSKVGIEGEITTKFNDEQFLYFATNSSLGIALIQRGHLIYFNEKFVEIFGYTEDEIYKWKKREFYKIVHPEDLKKITQNLLIEDQRTAFVRFRGIKKNGEIIPIENFIGIVYYNSKKAYLSTYLSLEKPIEEIYKPKTIRIKTRKKIVLDYHPGFIKTLKINNIKFDIIINCSYKEED